MKFAFVKALPVIAVTFISLQVAGAVDQDAVPVPVAVPFDGGLVPDGSEYGEDEDSYQPVGQPQHFGDMRVPDFNGMMSFPELKLPFTPLDEKLRIGIESFRENDYAATIENISGYLANNPNSGLDAEARLVLGVALLESGNSADAIRMLSNGRSPKFLEDYKQYFLAEAYFREGLYRDALKLFEEIPQKYADSNLHSRAMLRKADSLFALDEYRETFTAYDDYLVSPEGKGGHESIFLNMARCALESDDPASAAKYLIKIWYRYPASILAPKASKMLKEISRNHPELGRPTYRQRFKRILKLHHFGMTKTAIDELTDLYEEVPNTSEYKQFNEDMYLKLGALYASAKDGEEAGRIYRGIVEDKLYSQVSRQKALLEMAGLEKKLDHNDKAEELYIEYADTYPSSGDADNAIYNAAWLNYSLKDYERAAELFEYQVEQFPQSDMREDALWFLAWIKYRSGDLKKARELLLILVADLPLSDTAPRASYFAAKFALLLGLEQDAREGFKNTVRNYPFKYYAFLAQHQLQEHWGEKVLAIVEEPLPKPETLMNRPICAPDAGTEPETDKTDPSNMFQKFASQSRNLSALNRAAALIRLGLNDEAGSELAALRNGSGGDLEAHYMSALLYQLVDDYYRSIISLRKPFIEKLLNNPSLREIRYWKMMFPPAFRAQFEESSKKNLVDQLLILAIMREESTFRPKVVSPVGARGLMQIMPKTGGLIAKRLKVDGFDADDLYDPKTNIMFGGWYLRELLEKFKGQIPLAVASYNAGPGAVSKWLRERGKLDIDEFIEEIPFRETRNYVKRVLQTYGIYRFLYLSENNPLQIFSRIDDQYKDNIDF